MGLDDLDHPVVFIVLVTMAVLGMSSILTWGFKRVGWTGPAGLTQNP